MVFLCSHHHCPILRLQCLEDTNVVAFKLCPTCFYASKMQYTIRSMIKCGEAHATRYKQCTESLTHGEILGSWIKEYLIWLLGFYSSVLFFNTIIVYFFLTLTVECCLVVFSP